ncbi:hypothetical protein BD324DRAFT_616077 [Kockovaella imperatae]|uniref:ABC transporter domain-containing protein n=1 Tax=Kockovaella imperatae TaxID=4999 RepID=A0A1Y1UR33_9TREE|nr:hypothetical protein BD324DRAFT_616077 [Kockovaella imperatae]ORX40047.1 hypothetical protein BD324DRAFT_616077 [Kockovaella imperatae]
MFFFTSLLLLLSSAVEAQTCSQYGTLSGSSCLCPPGFNVDSSSNNDCSVPMCGGSLYDPGSAASIARGSTLANLSSQTCQCADGWSGPTCTVCSSATSCQSSLSKYLNSSNTVADSTLNTSLTCSSSPVTYSSSQMFCDVTTSILHQLYAGSWTLSITRTLNASRTPGGLTTLDAAKLMGGDSHGYAQLWYDGVEQFYCQASQCDQVTTPGSAGRNGSTWTCSTLNCTCLTDATLCKDLSSKIDTLVGPLTVDCSGTDYGNCTFLTPFLESFFGPSGLGLSSCSFGECVQQYVIDQALGISEAVSYATKLSGGVIAGLAVVGVLLLVIIVLLIWAWMIQRKARKNMTHDGQIPKNAGARVAWSGVTYEVKAAGVSHWDRLVTWAKGSGSAGNSTAASSERGDGLGPAGGKIVLSDSCGDLPVGGFACILGPSGAGKSTLVDILAGKRKAGNVQGSVKFAKSGGGRIKIGYVDQSDVLSPTSTVLETLIFAAQLRLPESVPESVKIERANTVLQQLGLEHVAHTRVGSTEHRGISGGEMRRVSIGIELVAAPDVLVLDEPTSGLDSVSASRLVSLLKQLAEGDSQTTIIASIHQPSSALYRAFSQVVLLANGKQLYFGPGGDQPALFFARQGRPCPAGYNVADHLLEIASGPTDGLVSGPSAVVRQSADNGSDQESSSLQGNEKSLSSSGAQSHTDSSVEKDLVTPALQAESLPKHPDGEPLSVEKTSWWPRTHCATTFLTQVEVLSGREWKNLRRDKTLLIAHWVMSCILGVFAGGLYYKVSLTIAGFQNRVGSLFFLGSLIAFTSLSALYNLVEVRGLFLRERAGSFYSPQSWLLTRVIFDVIPLRLIPTIIVGIIVYFMVGLAHSAARFFKYLLILVEYSLATTLFNFLLACVFRQGGIAILLSSLCNLFLMTYAGFFVNIHQIPPVLRWLRYFSTLGYTLEALSVNEVGSGLMIIDVLEGVPIEINAVVIMQTLFGFDLSHYYRDVLVLFAFVAGFAILLVGAVVFILRERR